jgi:hypothetical protein
MRDPDDRKEQLKHKAIIVAAFVEANQNSYFGSNERDEYWKEKYEEVRSAKQEEPDNTLQLVDEQGDAIDYQEELNKVE